VIKTADRILKHKSISLEWFYKLLIQLVF
jgi:hypothetical protein